jgi:ATP-dependent Clp protease ATP-binding subunit ClpB
MSRDELQESKENSIMDALIRGHDLLTERPNFKLIGREADLDRLSAILMRDKANSVIISGPGGVGCSAICMGLQARKSEPNAPFDIINKRLFWLDVDRLFASGDAKQIDQDFKWVISLLERTNDSILIIEDTKDFLEAIRNNGVSYFINSLNSCMKKDLTQIIFAVRDEDLNSLLNAHSDMREYYTLMFIDEPKPAALPKIIEGVSMELEVHHGIKIHPEAISVAIDLTTKYRTEDAGLSRAQPERSITLLDRALATYRLNAHEQHPKVPALLEKLKLAPQGEQGGIGLEISNLQKEFLDTQEQIKKLYRLQRDGEDAIFELEERLRTQLEKEKASRQNDKEEDTESIRSFSEVAANGGVESNAVFELRQKIAKFEEIVGENRKKYEALTADINSQLLLTTEMVMAEFSNISGIPADKLNENEREKLKNLEGNIQNFIYGQNEVVKAVADSIKAARIARRADDDNKPQASYFFLGPSGVGKSEICRVLAELLYDNRAALFKFNMAEYSEQHAKAKLIGAPPGYEGFEVGGILTNGMRKNPNRALLFDETEKAHDTIFDLFLSILDDGELSDSVGRKVYFKNTLVFMTSNIGLKHFMDKTLTRPQQIEAAWEDLKVRYRPEFLNRFNGRENVMCFNTLGLDSIQRIVTKEITKINAKYAHLGIGIDFNQDTFNDFCRDRYDPAIGARGIPGYINKHIEPFIVNTAFDDPNFKGRFLVNYDTNSKTLSYEVEK